MSLILPDREIDAALEGWYYTTTGYEYERALCQAQARHMAREIVGWLGAIATEERDMGEGRIAGEVSWMQARLKCWLRSKGLLEEGETDAE